MKKCFKCGQFLPLDSFYKHSAMKDGHLNKCIECTLKDVKKHREENIDKIREYDRKRGLTEERKAKNREYLKMHPEKKQQYIKKYNDSHPWVRKADSAAGKAKTANQIVVDKCAVCGSKNQLEMHHFDYNKPKNVIILCYACHKKVHRKYNPIDIQEMIQQRNSI